MIVALVPAAGLSRRMGRPKLILDLEEPGRSVIAHVVEALREGGLTDVLVLAPPPDQAGARTLAEHATRAGPRSSLSTRRRPTCGRPSSAA